MSTPHQHQPVDVTDLVGGVVGVICRECQADLRCGPCRETGHRPACARCGPAILPRHTALAAEESHQHVPVTILDPHDQGPVGAACAACGQDLRCGYCVGALDRRPRSCGCPGTSYESACPRCGPAARPRGGADLVGWPVSAKEPVSSPEILKAFQAGSGG